MTITLNPAEFLSCDREPIHTPGSVQPHGVMLMAERENFHTRHVAGDIEHRLGVKHWQDQPLSSILGDAFILKLREHIDAKSDGLLGQMNTPNGEILDVSVCGSGAYAIVEFEAASMEAKSSSFVTDKLAAAAAGLERATSLKSLCERAAAEFRRLIGFDRVMVSQFLSDGAGCVVAEDKRVDLSSFLNQHFPATDIPSQARDLYLRNLVRVIPNISYRAAELRPHWVQPDLLDMTDSNLRAVSPVHLQYLANMGVQASASFSIVRDGALWGLIACHNESPRQLSYDIRSTCRSLVGSLSREIKAKEEAESYRQRIRLRSFQDSIAAECTNDASFDHALTHRIAAISRVMNANGMAMIRGDEIVVAAVCPTQIQLRPLVAWLLSQAEQPVVAFDNLSARYPAGTEFQQTVSGVLSVVMTTEDPWLLIWFRAEQVEVVRWAGNPFKASGTDHLEPLTPRASFAEWSQTVRGRTRAWSLAETDAAVRLRLALLDIQRHQQVRDLNAELTKVLADKVLLLKQKEFLIGEVNHRVQNSLQIVASFLTRQGRGSKNTELQEALEEARRRLTAVPLVHRKLYAGNQVGAVNAAHYIEELCSDTVSFMGPEWAQHLSLNLAPVLLSVDRAVAMGLVLTELVINSNKYAYGGGVLTTPLILMDSQLPEFRRRGGADFRISELRGCDAGAKGSI